MSDSFTEVSSRSWLQRIGGALTGLLVGLLLVPGMVWMLFWNEGRAVDTERALDEGAGLVRTIDPATHPLAGAEANGLVHFSGRLMRSAAPRDPHVPGLVLPDDAIRLDRRVEMYQWIEDAHTETRKTLGGGEETVTTYSYRRDWADRPVDSGGFRRPEGHHNPPMPVVGESFSIPRATIGRVVIGADLLSGIGRDERLALPGGAEGEALARTLARDLGLRRPALVRGDQVWIGRDPGAPAVGDLRIGFSVARAPEASAYGALSGGALVPYVASNGTQLVRLQDGVVEAAAMFAAAQSENAILTWILRAVGLGLLWLGFHLILRVISVIGDLVPMIGTALGWLGGAVSLVLALLVGPTVIGLAWIWYRPVLGLAVIAVGAGLAVAIGWSRARRAPLKV